MLDSCFIIALTANGRIMAFELLNIACVWSITLDPLIDYSRLKEASISPDGFLSCWMNSSDLKIYTLSRDISQYRVNFNCSLPDITTRIYDLYSDRTYYKENGISPNIRSDVSDKLCIVNFNWVVKLQPTKEIILPSENVNGLDSIANDGNTAFHEVRNVIIGY
jgi:hypothetical protein